MLNETTFQTYLHISIVDPRSCCYSYSKKDFIFVPATSFMVHLYLDFLAFQFGLRSRLLLNFIRKLCHCFIIPIYGPCHVQRGSIARDALFNIKAQGLAFDFTAKVHYLGRIIRIFMKSFSRLEILTFVAKYFTSSLKSYAVI